MVLISSFFSRRDECIWSVDENREKKGKLECAWMSLAHGQTEKCSGWEDGVSNHVYVMSIGKCECRWTAFSETVLALPVFMGFKGAHFELVMRA